MTSMGSQRSTPQMIPTPGFVNSGTNSNSGGFSAEPTVVPQSHQQQQQREVTGGQNSHILSNQMTTGRRPGMQPNAAGVATNSVNGGAGVKERSVDKGNSSTNLQQSSDNLPLSGKQSTFVLPCGLTIVNDEYVPVTIFKACCFIFQGKVIE